MGGDIAAASYFPRSMKGVHRMNGRHLTVNILLAAVLMAATASCQKNESETHKFPRADDASFHRVFGDMTSFTLDNGITCFLQEETSQPAVSVELFYRAGFTQEPKGMPQVAHLCEHAVVFSPTDSFKTNAILDILGPIGRVAAEAVGDFVHFDYAVQPKDFEKLLQLTSEQLTSIRFTPDVLKEQSRKAAKEIDAIQASDRGSLRRFAMMAMLHGVHYGSTFVPVKQANFDRTVDDLTAFHKDYYDTEDMTIVVVGNVPKDQARTLIEKYFGSIHRTPRPDEPINIIDHDLNVRWDIKGSSVFLVYPGPFDDERERAALVAFGSYLNQYIKRDDRTTEITRSTYCTNPTYTLTDLPFFVFAEPAPFRSVSDTRDHVIALTDSAVTTLDEEMFKRVITSLKSFVTSSFLAAQADNPRVDHIKVIGQHAVNTGIKHYLKNGRSDEEFNAMLDSITYDEMKQILAKYLAPERRHIVTITGP